MELKKEQYERISECFPKLGSIKRGAVRSGEWVQMEETAQRIRRLARDLCPGESLGQKRSSSRGVSAFAAVGNHPNQSKRSKLGFHLYQSASRRYGCFEKMALSPSKEQGADGIPNFIWSPHLIEMG